MKVLDADGDGVITKSEFQQLQVPGGVFLDCGMFREGFTFSYKFFCRTTVAIASDTLYATEALVL